MKNCTDCNYWHPTGKEPYEGYCHVSINCINSPSRPRHTPKDEVKPLSDILLKEIKVDKVKGTIAYIDANLAQASRERSPAPMYPDMRQLTDSSKAELRRIARANRSKPIQTNPRHTIPTQTGPSQTEPIHSKSTSRKRRQK